MPGRPRIFGSGPNAPAGRNNHLQIQFKGKTAKEADAFLTKRGLVLRQVGAYKLPNALRMSVGTEEANRLVVPALKEFLGSRR